MESVGTIRRFHRGSHQPACAFRCRLLFAANGAAGLALVAEVSQAAWLCQAPIASDHSGNTFRLSGPRVLWYIHPPPGTLSTALLEEPVYRRHNELPAAFSIL